MSEQNSGEDTLWWTVEPPDDAEGLGAYPHPDYESLGLKSPEELDKIKNREYADSRLEHLLFKDVAIVENEGGLKFAVPRRYIDTSNDGKWSFEVYGGRRWFKERDDYGQFRTTTSGVTLWIPHLFPFEETDDRGLPLIADRERCQVEVSMQSVEGEGDRLLSIGLSTKMGKLTASPAPESYNPDYVTYFNQFESESHSLDFDKVTYPERRWPSFQEYADEHGIELMEYLDIRLGKKPFPEEYSSQDRPNDWQQRQRSGFVASRFGSIWVPVDELRRGVEASISFPCFS